MSLDPTAMETNLRDSLKKYLWDNLDTIEGLTVSFDRWLIAPEVRGLAVDKWIGVKIAEFERLTLSDVLIEFYCCSVRDTEGNKVSELCDILNGYLTDSAQTDGMRRIPFYQRTSTGPWTLIGSIIVQQVYDGKELELLDGTKYKITTARLRFASKI